MKYYRIIETQTTDVLVKLSYLEEDAYSVIFEATGYDLSSDCTHFQKEESFEFLNFETANAFFETCEKVAFVWNELQKLQVCQSKNK